MAVSSIVGVAWISPNCYGKTYSCLTWLFGVCSLWNCSPTALIKFQEERHDYAWRLLVVLCSQSWNPADNDAVVQCGHSISHGSLSPLAQCLRCWYVTAVFWPYPWHLCSAPKFIPELSWKLKYQAFWRSLKPLNAPPWSPPGPFRCWWVDMLGVWRCGSTPKIVAWIMRCLFDVPFGHQTYWKLEKQTTNLTLRI